MSQPQASSISTLGHEPVVVIFDNFGPYHVARVAAAAGAWRAGVAPAFPLPSRQAGATPARRMPLLALELKGRSKTYGWTPPASPPFAKRSLTSPDETATAELVAPRLRAALAEARPAAVCVNGWYDFLSLTTIRWCATHGVPFVVMSESPLPVTPPPRFREWIKRRIVRLARAALVGGQAHAEYARQLGLPADAVFTGYDAVDNDYFAEGAAAARANATAVRKQLGLPENFFLASKRFVPKKNIPRLLEAFAGYRTDSQAAGREPWQLVLLGDGLERADVVERIAKLGLQGEVLLPGFRAYDELPAYYGLAGAFIHASTHEEWGLVVNEAMAAGLPLLLSRRCGCAADLLEEGRNGFGFDPLDVTTLRGLMLKVAGPSFDRAGFAAAGQGIVSRFSPEQFGAGFFAAMNCAIQRGAPHLGLLDRFLLRVLDRA